MIAHISCVCPSCGDVFEDDVDLNEVKMVLRTRLGDIPMRNCGEHSELDMKEAFLGNRAIKKMN